MSKKTYEALPGVEWVNGEPVPESREMKLSAAEAMFDLAQGRIQLKDDEPAAEYVPQEALDGDQGEAAAVAEASTELRKRR